jgi:hypothetical protein
MNIKKIMNYVELYLHDKIDMVTVRADLDDAEFEDFIDEVKRSGG